MSQPFFLIAGPCVIEDKSMIIDTAGFLKEITDDLGIELIFKASYDKANRTSEKSFRGLGIERGLNILNQVREQVGVMTITDVHEDSPVNEVASVVDMLQTPAFLVRQTNFIKKVCSQGLPVNIKKGQFQAPWDMVSVVEKAKSTGNNQIMLTDRGTSFGYNTLVSDFRGLWHMAQTGCPVIYDATHSVQEPGVNGNSSGGDRRFVPGLARAAVAHGVDGLFIECHPNPDKALSDGPNSMNLSDMKGLLTTLKEIDKVVKSGS